MQEQPVPVDQILSSVQESPALMPESSESLAFNNRPDLRRTDVASLRAMLEKTVSNPQAPCFKDEIDKFERSYADHLEQTRIFISRPNQVPGYRTFIIMGPGIEYPDCDHADIIAVTADGRLVMEEVICDFGTDLSVSSIIATSNRLISERFNEGERSGINGCPLDLFGVKTTDFQNYGQELDLELEPFLHNPDICDKILEIIKEEIKNHLTLVCDALCNALDRDVLTTILDTEIVSFEQGEWLTGGDGVSREIILARQQAVHAYPILAFLFNSYCPLMGQAIDNRTSLSDAIAAYFKTDTRRVKRLQGLTWQHVATGPKGRELFSRIRDILEFPEGAVPKTPEQFRKLDIFQELGAFVFGTELPDTMKRLSESGNPWRLIDRLERTSGRNISDAIVFLGQKLLVPAIFNRIAAIAEYHGITPDFNMEFKGDITVTEQTFNRIRDMFNPGQLLDWSERYHRNIARYEDRLNTVSSEYVWSGLVNTLDFGNGYIARELTSAQDLKIQGKTENHCVGGYLSLVLSGETRGRGFTLVFSVEKDDVTLSTVEIECIRKTDMNENNEVPRMQVIVHQNLTNSNKVPSKDADRIVDQIVEKLKTIDFGICQAYLDDLDQLRLEYNHDSLINFCGFDPLDRTMMERAWEDLSLALPRGKRKGGLDKFIDEVSVSKLLLGETLGYSNRHLCDQGQVFKTEHDMNSPGAGS